MMTGSLSSRNNHHHHQSDLCTRANEHYKVRAYNLNELIIQS
jgi:hypothetical protein